MSDRQGVADDDIVQLMPLVRRVISARVRDADTTEDLTQETLARLIEVRPRLSDESLPAYAAATARNLTYSLGRQEQRHRRHAPRLIDLVDRDRPEDEALRHEDVEAIAAALKRLSEQERREVVAHEVMGEGTASLAREAETTPGAIAVRLASTRAKLRVDYLLALQREDPPTPRCRPVLISLSSGDRRRQGVLRAGEHLVECRFCSALSEPVVHRRRPLAALWPLPAVVELKRIVAALLHLAKKSVLAGWKAGWQWVGTLLPTPVAKIVAGALASLVVGGVVAGAGDSPKPTPPARAQDTLGLTVRGRPVSPTALATAPRYTGSRPRGRGVPIMSDLADEGFWVGDSRENRIWVAIIHTKGESNIDLDADDEVTFVGRVVRHGRGYAAALGLGPSEEGDVLRQQINHIEVAPQHLRKA